jgi:plastocyanin domain-containing protein
MAKLIVTIAGVLLIVLVNWYFLFSTKKTESAGPRDEKK